MDPQMIGWSSTHHFEQLVDDGLCLAQLGGGALAEDRLGIVVHRAVHLGQGGAHKRMRM
jgi:hypothetical protein